MALNYVALTVTEQDAGQDAGTGSVLIVPTALVTAAGVTEVSTIPVVRQLSGGSVVISLVATDNTGTTPAAGFWAYQITLPGQQPQLYLVAYANGASQRLDNLTPVVAMTTYGPAAATSGVTSFNSRTGAVTPQSGDYTAAQVSAVAKAGDTMTGHLAPKVVTLTDGSSVALDASAGNVFRWALAGASHTLAAPSNPVDGQQISVDVKYGGSFTPLFSAAFDFGSATPSWTATSGKTDTCAFRYDAAAASGAGSWLYLGMGAGYTS